VFIVKRSKGLFNLNNLISLGDIGMLDIEKIIESIRSLNNLNDLKRIRDVVDERIEELRKGKEWTDNAILELWKRLSEDQRRLIRFLAKNGGEALKSEVMKEFDWKEMKVTGVIAGINNRARNMGFKDVIEGEYVQINGDWDRKYKLDRSWLNFIKSFK